MVNFWKRICFATLLFTFFFQVSSAQHKQHNRIVGYIMGSQLTKLTEEVEVEKLTHINYAFADVVNGEVVEISDQDTMNMAYLNSLKTRNSELKILISVGGWTRSGGFSDAALTVDSREKFANSAIAFMLRHKLDGIDLDWEYPGLAGIGNTHRAEDKENFTALLELIREKLDVMGDYLLTIASAAGANYLDHVEMDKIHHSLDFINIMTYDYYGAWSKETGNHAALHPHGSDAVDRHLSHGVPSEKLVLGVAFYGRGWKNVDGLKAQASDQPFSLNYYDIKDSLDSYKYYWDTIASAPYIYNQAQRTFIGYDDPLSLRLKTEYVRDKQLGGVMFWEYSGDAAGELLGALHSGLNSLAAHAHNDYENEEPLHKALNLGLRSIEVDVHLIDDELYVSHNKPYRLSPEKTLQEMYLRPLASASFTQFPLYLLIDVKTNADATYKKLKEILPKYRSDQVVFVISGNRAIEKMSNDPLRTMTIDGRPGDLSLNIPSSYMPMISQNYRKYFSSRDPLKIDQKEKKAFQKLVREAHRKHMLVRLWASPDTEEMWKFLIDQGVDLINTDDPEAFNKYTREGN